MTQRSRGRNPAFSWYSIEPLRVGRLLEYLAAFPIPEDKAHIRALLLQAMSRSSLTLTGLRSEDIEGTPKMTVTSQITDLGRRDVRPL